jgi:hypothetical protein
LMPTGSGGPTGEQTCWPSALCKACFLPAGQGNCRLRL